jgi:hypothetical protein
MELGSGPFGISLTTPPCIDAQIALAILSSAGHTSRSDVFLLCVGRYTRSISAKSCADFVRGATDLGLVTVSIR